MKPFVAGNQPNHSAGIQENLDADAAATFDVKENESEVHVSLSSSDKIKKHDEKTKIEAKGKSPVDLSIRVRNLSDEFEDFSSNSANSINAASVPVTAIGPNLTNSTYSFNAANMAALEDIVYLDDEEDVGAEADFSILETSITISPILTTRVHKDHPVTQIISDLTLAPQTRIMERMVKEQGFEDPDYPDKVYKVVKAIYGLLQALKAWYETLANYLLENGFQRGTIDQTLFIKKQKDGKSASTPIDTKKPLLKDPDGEDVNEYIYTVAYSDSDYAKASLDKKYTTGGCQFLGCRVISWKCKKQTVVATSSTEAEYVAAASCCAQFWASFSIKKSNDVVKLQALIDRKKVIITEDTIRQDLRLDDADGVDCLPNEEIFANLARMGYEKPMVRNVDSPSKFLMYPWFLQVMISAQIDDISLHNTKNPSPALIQKVFTNMRRIGNGFLGVETPLFDTMLVQPQVQDVAKIEEVEDDHEVPAAYTPPSPTPPPPQQEPIPLPPQAYFRDYQAQAEGQEVREKYEIQVFWFKDVKEELDADEDVTLVDTLIKMKAKKARILDEQMAERLQDEEIEQVAAREKQEKEDLERAKVLKQQYDQKQESIDWNVVSQQMQGKHLDNIKKVGGVTQAFQSFEDMLKDFDREDLDALHYPIMWKLHSNSGVHQVSPTTRRYDVYMLAEKEYPLSNQVITLMLRSRLQVEEDTKVARDLVMKVFLKANQPKSKSLDTSSN
nr:reverse transcriptase [Tanacetum cinerariifolium]